MDSRSFRRPAAWAAREVAACLIAIVCGAGSAAPVIADEVSVDADYSATIGGFPIASGTLRFKLNDQSYDASINAKVSGLAALIASRSAVGGTRGRIVAGHISPQSYSLTISGGQAVNEVVEDFVDNKVVALAATELNLAGWTQRVPLLPSHKVGVVDPLGAFVLPASDVHNPLTPAACNRTLKIFDGRVRYDLHLVYGASNEVKGDTGSYSGPAVVCAVAYRPIAGHRILSPEQQKFERNIEFSIWFVPVGSTGILLPHRIVIGTQMGLLVVNATRFEVHGGNPVVAAVDQPAVVKHRHIRRHKPDPDEKPADAPAADVKPAAN